MCKGQLAQGKALLRERAWINDASAVKPESMTLSNHQQVSRRNPYSEIMVETTITNYWGATTEFLFWQSGRDDRQVTKHAIATLLVPGSAGKKHY